MDLNLIANNIGFDTKNYWALSSQIIAIIPFGWFTWHSVLLFIRGLRGEHAKQGSIPVLAFLYMVFSIWFTILFIRNFGEIRDFNERQLLNILDHTDSLFLYLLFLNILTSSILIAFTANFCKSFYTLNSLEFGILQDKELKEVFKLSDNNAAGEENKNWLNKNKQYIEAFVRLVIACFFVFLEKMLATPKIEINAKGESFLTDLGLLTIGLYFFLLLWLRLYDRWFDKKDANTVRIFPDSWYKNSYWQFGCGLLIGIFWVFFGLGQKDETYKMILLVSLLVGIASAGKIIYTIIQNELVQQNRGTSATQ
jgi:hypothetical protein